MTPTENRDLHDKNGSHLEALLREPDGYLGDDGFTERVMAALPPRRRARRWRPVILVTCTVLASLTALVAALGVAPVAHGHLVSDAIWQAMTWTPPQLGMPLVPLVAGLIILAGSLAYSRT